MQITIGNTTLSATLVDNSSTKALKELLKQGPIIVHMRDFANLLAEHCHAMTSFLQRKQVI